MATGDKLVNLDVLKNTVQKEVVDLKSALSYFDSEGKIVTYPALENGDIDGGNGNNKNDGITTKVRTTGYISSEEVTNIEINPDTHFLTYVNYYDSSKVFLNQVSYNATAKSIDIDTTKSYFRMIVIDYTGQLWSNSITPEAVKENYIFYKNAKVISDSIVPANLLKNTDITNSSDIITESYSSNDNGITLSISEKTNWIWATTKNGWISRITPGKTYKLSGKCQTVNGNPYCKIVVRGTSTSPSADAVTLDFTSTDSAKTEFVATKYMREIIFMISDGSAVAGSSVKYYDLVLYDIESLRAVDDYSRTFIGDINKLQTREKDDLVSAINSVIDFDPMPFDIPVVTIDGMLPSAKSEGDVQVVVTYNSERKSFKSYATVKVQGDSSAYYPKKNFTVKLFSDSNRTKKLKEHFRDWDKSRNKYVLKANWIDHSHARNIVNARLWSQVVKSREDFDALPDELTSGNLAVDGFPVKVFNNGVYMGLYTWNLPKDSLYGLDDEVDTNAIVQGASSTYSGSVLWRSSTIDGMWSDETHDSMPSAIITGFNALLNFVYTSSNADFVSGFDTHFDKRSIIDQYIMLYSGCIVDNIGKNQTFFTYDGNYWYGGMYDMDGTWGLPPWQMETVGWKPANTSFQGGYSAVAEGSGDTNLLYERLQNLFSSDIMTRYAELRESVLSESNVCLNFEKFISTIPPHLYEEDYASTTGNGKFTSIPLKTTNNVQQIRKFVVDRFKYVDGMILPPVIAVQPVDKYTTLNGQVELSVIAKRAASYQWQWSRDGASWGNCGETGYDTDTITITYSTANRAFLFRCAITGGLTNTTIYTDAVQIYEAGTPVITTQPENKSKSVVGTAVKFTVVATNVKTYQWQWSSNNGTTWGNCSEEGNQTNEMTVTPTQWAVDNLKYRCVITGTDDTVIYTNVVGYV